jgi:hypothetical protein
MPEKENLGADVAYRSPTLEEERNRLVQPIKDFRKEVDAMINRFTRPYSNKDKSGGDLLPGTFGLATEAATEVRIHLTEAKMWAGKILEGLGNPFPAELADKADAQ